MRRRWRPEALPRRRRYHGPYPPVTAACDPCARHTPESKNPDESDTDERYYREQIWTREQSRGGRQSDAGGQ